MNTARMLAEMKQLLRAVDDARHEGRGETRGPRIELAHWVEARRHDLERAMLAAERETRT